MGLELMIDLDAMLGSTEEQVCLTQFVHRPFVQKSCLTEKVHGLQGAGRPHSWRFPAINKLKRLNKEFDLPDSSLAQLYVDSRLSFSTAFRYAASSASCLPESSSPNAFDK